MEDLQRALSEISAIRGQLARGTLFRGYGPTTLALTAALAVAGGLVQSALLPDPGAEPRAWLGLWFATAILSAGVVGWEAVTRARRLHSDLADEMIREAALRFAPAAVAGGVLPFVLLQAAPEALWMMPGLWQILFALGVFAAATSLPRPMAAVGVWYLACGLLVLAARPEYSPWAMALPFALGQLLSSVLLLYVTQAEDADE